jgi:hypothetical protein
MRVRGKESRLAFRIASISAMGVSLDQLADGEAIRDFLGGDGAVFCSSTFPLGIEDVASFKKCSRR